MTELVIDCAGISTEAAFWQRYLEAARPEGASFFGRNLDAFRDALLAGGPGWPGEHTIELVNTAQLQAIADGRFLKTLLEIITAAKHN